MRRQRRYRRFLGKDVTLVAGFKCSNGVVICADTHYTGPSIKFAAPKMWTDRDRTVVAGACNDVGYLRMAVDEISERLENLSQWSRTSVKQARW
jgi:hypothetical protein